MYQHEYLQKIPLYVYKLKKDIIFNNNSQRLLQKQLEEDMDTKTEQPQPGSQEHNNNQTQNLVSSSNTQSIHYEDGLIQKKVYGGESGSLQQYYVHFIERTKQQVHTVIAKIQNTLTLTQACTLLEQKTKTGYRNIEVKLNLEGGASDLNSTLESLKIQKKQDKSELFVFYDEVKAIIKEKAAQIKYEALTKYSFLDDKSKVKVYLELPDIGKVPADKITSRFLQWSFEVKIHDYKGKNWIFAVPKTQCIVKAKESKVIIKQNKLIISIAKNTDSDNWFSLYKVKCVGQRDD